MLDALTFIKRNQYRRIFRNRFICRQIIRPQVVAIYAEASPIGLNDMTREQDIVLIYYQDTPLSFARIESIKPDIKKDWYHVKLLILQMPPRVTTWLLRDTYINGVEFTMGGKRMRLERIECPPDEDPTGEPEKSTIGDKPLNAKIIPISASKKKIDL